MTRAADPDIRALVLDLLAWITAAPRTDDEVMTAWRTPCPALTIWDDAADLGLVRREHQGGIGTVVTVTDRGRAVLADRGRTPGA